MEAQKLRGREGIVSAHIVLLFVPVLILLSSSLAQAIDVEFWSDATIDDGDVYDIVRIYDTPPDWTNVDMYGGSVESLRTYDSSTANIYGGQILIDPQSRDSSTINIYGGAVICVSMIVWDSSTLNIYGGDLNVSDSPYFSELSTVNIYGYDFNYDGLQLTGFLSDGSAFLFNELSFDKYSHMNLIPEPASVLLFAIVGLLIRKRT